MKKAYKVRPMLAWRRRIARRRMDSVHQKFFKNQLVLDAQIKALKEGCERLQASVSGPASSA